MPQRIKNNKYEVPKKINQVGFENAVFFEAPIESKNQASAVWASHLNTKEGPVEKNFTHRTTKMDRTSMRIKKIKRYGNRKLYDTEQSTYVILNDIAKMVREGRNILIIDNETQEDITISVFTQIIFNAERVTSQPASLNILKSIIQTGDGSFSNYLSKRPGLEIKPQIQDSKINIEEKINTASPSSEENQKKSEIASHFQHKPLHERIVSALSPDSTPSGEEDTILPTSRGNTMEK